MPQFVQLLQETFRTGSAESMSGVYEAKVKIFTMKQAGRVL